MARDPTKAREEVGKYGAIARDEEQGVKEAWRAREDDDAPGEASEGLVTSRLMKNDSKKRPNAPPGEPKGNVFNVYAQRAWYYMKLTWKFLTKHLWVLFLVYVFVAITILHFLPNEPDFDTSVVDTMYFVAITATTIGYGDFYPKSDEGKIFVMCFIVIGVGLGGVLISNVTAWMLEKEEAALKEVERKKMEKMQKELLKVKQNVGADVSSADIARASRELASKKVNKLVVWHAIGAIIVVVLLGAVIMGQLENLKFLDGCYWAIVTSTTVGYGDITPKTTHGRIFASFYAFITIGVMGWAVSQISSSAITRKVEEEENEVTRFKLTPDSLVAMGGEKGYVDQYDFAVAMLLAMGKATREDFDMVAAKFRELDVNGDKTLDAKDLLGEK